MWTNKFVEGEKGRDEAKNCEQTKLERKMKWIKRERERVRIMTKSKYK